MGGNGIKVVPQIAVPVEPGNLVDVSGSVVPSSTSVAECYVSAGSVKCNGSSLFAQCGRSLWTVYGRWSLWVSAGALPADGRARPPSLQGPRLQGLG